jgi:cytidine deaminase
MKTAAESAHRPELVFALVGAAGTRLPALSTALKDSLATFGYKAIDIHLSDLLSNVKGWTSESDSSVYTRIRHRQTFGNTFRSKLSDGAAVALAGIAAVREQRMRISKNPDLPAPAHAYIIHQLKHPAEVDLLRKVYGSSFLLIAGHATRTKRIKDLSERMAQKENKADLGTDFESKAIEIIGIDQNQDDDLGQKTRDTYPQADFFANLGPEGGGNDVRRFVELLFAHPFHTPSPEEYAMYQASAVSLRSSDDNRQVGAVIVSLTHDLRQKVSNVDIVASGMNEVPRGGGGFYWDGASPDARDQFLLAYKSGDRAKEIKISVLTELIERIRQKTWLQGKVAKSQSKDLAGLLLPDLRGTQFMDIGEFGRPVHAEMAALIDGARRGVAVNGHTMYVTTFPCHNCAKHIIAAGLRRVVYLEPYPKSRAAFLHEEEMEVEPEDGKEYQNKVVFFAFTGIAPRQYRQLFSMSERGSKKWIPLSKWEKARSTLSPRYVTQNASLAYLAAERQELERLLPEKYKWDKNRLCSKL